MSSNEETAGAQTVSPKDKTPKEEGYSMRVLIGLGVVILALLGLFIGVISAHKTANEGIERVAKVEAETADNVGKTNTFAGALKENIATTDGLKSRVTTLEEKVGKQESCCCEKKPAAKLASNNKRKGKGKPKPDPAPAVVVVPLRCIGDEVEEIFNGHHRCVRTVVQKIEPPAPPAPAPTPIMKTVVAETDFYDSVTPEEAPAQKAKSGGSSWTAGEIVGGAVAVLGGAWLIDKALDSGGSQQARAPAFTTNPTGPAFTTRPAGPGFITR